MSRTISTPNPSSGGPGPPPNRRVWLPLAVVVAGVMVLALLLGARWLHLRIEEADAEAVQAVATIESNVAISHLWLEEYVSGDEVDLEEIEARLDRADRLVQSLVPSSSGPHPVLLQEVERLDASLDQFRQIAEDRLLGMERGLAVGIGSPFDVEYDAVFARLLGHMEVLQSILVDHRDAGRRREVRVVYAFAGAWIVMISLAGATLWRREQRRLQAEAALDENRRQLWRVQRTEAVGRLAGGLAHDLDNYLAAIRAQCELVLMKSRDNEPVATKMQTSIGVVDKASSLLDRLLAFHRGAQIDHLEMVDLAATLLGLQPMIEAALGDGVELRLDPAPGLWPVLADPAGLEQVVINLAVNANDAMPEGGRLQVTAENCPRSGEGSYDHVHLVVADTGTGIAPDALERIFDPFWSTKGEGGHSGLGLAIVDSVVHQMRGRVAVESAPGRGTAFRIDLPAWPPGTGNADRDVILRSSSGS